MAFLLKDLFQFLTCVPVLLSRKLTKCTSDKYAVSQIRRTLKNSRRLKFRSNDKGHTHTERSEHQVFQELSNFTFPKVPIGYLGSERKP